MSTFLCYRIHKIQSFIFQIPKLPYIVGASSLIDQFDRENAKSCGAPDADQLFSGAGKGAFLCASGEAVDRVRSRLLERSREIGASIAFGSSAKYLDAAECRDQTFSYVVGTDQLDGHPCPKSGLYPVRDTGEHPVVRERDPRLRNSPIRRRFEERFQPDRSSLLPALLTGKDLEFFHDVSPDGEIGDSSALAAARSLGSRNRWAVIVMDGNAMGLQFDKLGEMEPQAQVEWLRGASKALDNATTAAVRKAIDRVVRDWGQDINLSDVTWGGRVVLPLRPLLIGGDDVKVLCHVKHASTFVREVCREFELQAEIANTAWKKSHADNLWHASEGRLTISAGILYSNVSLPLTTAIEYAESLLGNAKATGRKLRKTAPAPACVDWESVTASVIDNPTASRERDYRFLDGDLDGEIVSLTRRPYTFEEFEELEQRADRRYARVPATILHQVLPEMRKGYWDRELWRARLGKNQKELVADLAEPEIIAGQGDGSLWVAETTKDGTKLRSTDVIDAIDLLMERTRMLRDTVLA